ncbi:MAG: hypothetical protein QXT73_04950, partial [Candidatus Methanomethylicaceae archaeon]
PGQRVQRETILVGVNLLPRALVKDVDEEAGGTRQARGTHKLLGERPLALRTFLECSDMPGHAQKFRPYKRCREFFYGAPAGKAYQNQRISGSPQGLMQEIPGGFEDECRSGNNRGTCLDPGYTFTQTSMSGFEPRASLRGIEFILAACPGLVKNFLSPNPAFRDIPC